MGFEVELKKLEQHISNEDYAGICQFDALNSPLRAAALNLVLRPQRQRHPETIAGFIQGYCYWYSASGNPAYLKKAAELGDWLLVNDSATLGAFRGQGLAWGSPFQPTPHCDVTLYCGEALLDLFRFTGDRKYLVAAQTVARFILEDLPIVEETPYIRCTGTQVKGTSPSVLPTNAVAAGFLAKLSRATQDRALLDPARKMIQWVVSVKSPDHSWNYTYPKAQSGVGPNNVHTGLILNGIWDYVDVSGETRLHKDYFPALAFYRENFFDHGASKTRVNRPYPIQARAAAQGILTFSRATSWKKEYSEQARQIAEWTFDNLFDAVQGRFYLQKRRFFTWEQDLLQSSNSWMFQALTRWQYDSTLLQRKVA